MSAPERRARDWSWLEFAFLFCVLGAGAALRYWLSTVTPFSEREMGILVETSVPDHGARGPFIMVNGANLFLLYLLVRRSAGVETAFAVLLALQTSLTFQDLALRIWFPTFLLFPALAVLVYLRFQRPAGEPPPPRLAKTLVVLAVLMAARGGVLLVTLPWRMESTRTASAADAEALLESLQASGGGPVMPLAAFRTCAFAWPEVRSVAQQERLLDHHHLLGGRAVALFAGVPDGLPDELIVVFDPAAAAFLAVPRERLEVARRVVRADAPRALRDRL